MDVYLSIKLIFTSMWYSKSTLFLMHLCTVYITHMQTIKLMWYCSFDAMLRLLSFIHACVCARVYTSMRASIRTLFIHDKYHHTKMTHRHRLFIINWWDAPIFRFWQTISPIQVFITIQSHNGWCWRWWWWWYTGSRKSACECVCTGKNLLLFRSFRLFYSRVKRIKRRVESMRIEIPYLSLFCVCVYVCICTNSKLLHNVCSQLEQKNSCTINKWSDQLCEMTLDTHICY